MDDSGTPPTPFRYYIKEREMKVVKRDSVWVSTFQTLSFPFDFGVETSVSWSFSPGILGLTYLISYLSSVGIFPQEFRHVPIFTELRCSASETLDFIPHLVVDPGSDRGSTVCVLRLGSP